MNINVGAQVLSPGHFGEGTVLNVIEGDALPTEYQVKWYRPGQRTEQSAYFTWEIESNLTEVEL